MIVELLFLFICLDCSES